jgi:hypothetical protein
MAVDSDAAPMITSMLPAAARAALAGGDAVPSLRPAARPARRRCDSFPAASMRLMRV